ncbi:scavenger receptor class F member 2-like [Haliotis rubra]|uniref:scavenger receptor class F member 2-like n=1 Tax=Haliotis rubra TaxID=36100 RepID=UPI001EE4FEC3|nr:scavenger receptor class F member 2-like [Haliotis rubra]
MCLEPSDNSAESVRDMCVRDNGSCLNGCKDGHFGERCQHRCNTNCRACQQTSGHCTGRCNDGHYGESCEHNCRNCKHDKCSNDGLCYQCLDGYYGKNCNRQCDLICTSCERYNGVCQPQNLTGDDGGTVPKVPQVVTRTPTQSQRTAMDSYGPEIKSAETKSEESRGLPSFVIWLCVALGVLTVISLATIGICCNRAKNRRRKKNIALLTRSISHRNDPIPEVPSPVRTNVFSNDYDEIPEMSDEFSGRRQVYVDEGQNVLRVGVAHSVVDTANVGGIMTRDGVRTGKDVKYLSVTDVVTTEGYIDLIG